MKATIEKTLLLGLIVELCANGDDINLLDLIFKMLAMSVESTEE